MKNITENDKFKATTIYGKILVSPYDLLEKRRHQLTEDVELEIENKFNKNLRERNPQTAIVHGVYAGCKDIEVGDRILIYHFTFSDGNGDKVKPIYTKDGVEYYSVNYEECFFILDKEGEIVRPIGTYLLCQHIEEPLEEKTESGIFIPEMARNTTKRDDKKLLVLHAGNCEEVSVGDVIFAKYHYEITINKKKYIRIKEENILGVIV